ERPREVSVVLGEQAREDSRAGARETIGRLPGILERLPCNLEEQALLRVHLGGFAGRDAKERRVETVHSVEESSRAHVQLARRVDLGVVEARKVEAVGRYVGDRVASVPKQAPEIVRAVGASGETTPDSGDGDRLPSRSLQRIELRLQPLDRVQG